MTLKLTIGERLGIANLLNEIYSAGGLDLKSLNLAQKIVERVQLEGSFSFDKKGKAIQTGEYKDYDIKTSGAPGRPSLTWDFTKDKGKEIEFSVDNIKLIKEAIKSKNEKKAFTLADRHISTLAEKLEIE